MEYSKVALEKAIDIVLPSYSVMSNSFNFQMPEALKMAAIEIFMEYDTNAFKTNYSKNVAAHVIRVALAEIKEVGSISYGFCDNIYN